MREPLRCRSVIRYSVAPSAAAAAVALAAKDGFIDRRHAGDVTNAA